MSSQNLKNLDIVSITDLAIEFETLKKSSNKETLKVFNSNFEYVGTSTRLICHRLGLYHEVTNCFIMDENNNLLLQIRKDKIAETYDLSVGGHMNLDDKTPLDALIRESKEELNFNLNKNKIQKIITYKRYGYTNILKPRDTNNEFRHLFCYKIDKDEKIKLENYFSERKNSEAESFVWVSIDDTIDLITQGKAFDGLQYSIYYLLLLINKLDKKSEKI